jgi:hypothetical protein
MKEFKVGDKVEGYFIDNSQDPNNASYSNIKVKGVVVESAVEELVQVAFERSIMYTPKYGYMSRCGYDKDGRISNIAGQGIWHIDND